MNEWLADIDSLDADDDRFVIITVAGVRGSAPREIGAKMLVTAQASIGTIGGGQLEYQCTRIAVAQLLRDGASTDSRLRRRFPLGTNCGQCCGGVVDILFERVVLQDAGWLTELRQLHDERCPVVVVTPNDCAFGHVLVTAEEIRQFAEASNIPQPIIAAARRLISGGCEAVSLDGYLLQPVLPSAFNIAVFGAGHVGAATVKVLSGLDCSIRWIDSRRGVFPAVVAGNVTTVESADPAREVAAMPPGTAYLVMTHSHPLDFDISDQVLRRGDAAYCGLIGSLAKRRRFERGMRKQGMADAALAHLTCPIGVAGITSKKPADIAIAVAAEILRIRDAAGVVNQDNDRAPEQQNTNVHIL
jgi:xanthine dehydrogenase accessory factor